MDRLSNNIKGVSMAKYVVVAETGSDVPADLAERYGIRIVPMHVNLGDVTLDDGSFPVTDVFDYYKKTGQLPRTSGSTPQDFITMFDEIHEQDPEAHIVYLAYSAVTTCSYESAIIASEGRDYVTAIDTKSVAAGQCMVVVSVARYIEENPDVSLEEIKAYAADLISRIRMSFIPGGLEFLHAGGRLSNGAFLGAQLLRIKPVIEIIDGKLIATKKQRGSMDKCAMAMVEDFLTSEKKELDCMYFIRNQGLSEDIQKVVEKRAAAAGVKEFRWVETGCVIASHCGPGSCGIVGYAAK